MGLKPYDRTLSQIFNNIEYDVDFYQREYKWNDDLEYKPVSSLIKDIFYRFDLEKYNPNQIINAESTNRFEWYYLNSFMTNTIRGKKYIVDGQQRLTTLTLLLIGLYHLALEHGLEKHVIDTLRNNILGTTEYGRNYWMGFKNRDTILNDILENNLKFSAKATNISETNIYKNYPTVYNELKARLTTPHKLHTFISYFRNRIYLIEIEIDKDKDVAMVFEVINNRGIPLKPYEILKGKLLSQIEITDRDKYIQIWEEQISRIEKFGESEIDDFFGFYFRSKYADTTDQYARLDRSRYHKNIFLEDFNTRINLKNDEARVRDFIEKHLPYYVDIYITTLTHYNTYSKHHEHIYFNKINDIDGQFLLILSSINYQDADKIEKLKIVPKLFDKLFTISRLTNSYRSSDFNTYVISLNSKIRNQNILDITHLFNTELLSVVIESHDRPELTEPFRYEFFKNLGYNDFGAKFLRYFFARIDHYISDFAGENEYATYYQLVLQAKGASAFHIEHIISKNEECVKLFKDEDEFNEQRNRLGGLLLLKGIDNQSSGDELYPEKLSTYNVSGTFWARTLLSDMYHSKVTFKKFIGDNKLNFKPYSTFAKNEIEERHQLLFDIANRIWS